MTFIRRLLFILIFSLVSPSVLYAYDSLGLQPIAPYGIFSVMSAETLPRSGFALELSAERTLKPEYYRFGLKGAYALTDSIELDFMAPYVYHFANSFDGTEDFSFGLKHRFYDEGKYGPSLAYVVSASLNNGRDIFSTNGGLGLTLIASKRVGPFNGHINVSYQKPGTNKLKSEIELLGGLDFSAGHNSNLLAEVLFRKDNANNRYDDLEVRFGFRMRTLDFMYTTIGVGADLREKDPAYRFMLTISLISPQQKKEIKKIIEEE